MPSWNVSVAVALGTAALSVVIHYVAKRRSRRREPFLDRSRQTAALVEKEILTSDTRRLRFALPDGNVLGLPIGKHVKLIFKNTKGVVDGKWNGREDKEAGKQEVRLPGSRFVSEYVPRRVY